MNLQEQISRMKSMMGINESIDKTAGVWDTDEKFEDGSDFKISFKVSDVIDLSKDKPVEEINPKKINYNFEGRIEDESETQQRVAKANLRYPILVVRNEKGKIFSLLDGTHRLQKALQQKKEKIKVKIFDKEELKKFKVKELDYNEVKETELTEKCWPGYTQKGMKTMFGKKYPNCVKKTK